LSKEAANIPEAFPAAVGQLPERRFAWSGLLVYRSRMFLLWTSS